MSRWRGDRRPIRPEDINTPATALANLRPQLANAEENERFYALTDPQTSQRHGDLARRLKAEITEIERSTR